MNLIRAEKNKRFVERSLALAFEDEGLSWRDAGLALVSLQDIVWREFTKPSQFQPHDYYFDFVDGASSTMTVPLQRQLKYANGVMLHLGFFPERFEQQYADGLKERIIGIYRKAGRELSTGVALLELAEYFDPSIMILFRFWNNIPKYEQKMFFEDRMYGQGDGGIVVFPKEKEIQ